MTTRIKTIQEKLLELKNLDKGFSVFGSKRHKFQFHDVLTEDEIGQIESENGITISEDYRLVLKHLGNGGPGGGYGLERLSLKNINPEYVGTDFLLRNWNGGEEMDCDMIELDELSGYIKLFDYGCGIETCLVVNGKEQGELIWFDCDGRFSKLKGKSILDLYESWLFNHLSELKRVKEKLQNLPLQEIIDTEWETGNYFIKEMILSLIGSKKDESINSGAKMNEFLKKEYQKWIK